MTSYSPKVLAVATDYSDVRQYLLAPQYINTVTERKLMTGANGKFRPNDKITAAEVCTTIARQRGLSGSGAPPAGVRAGEWYSDAVSAVYANGLLEGLSDNFRPTAAMTREGCDAAFANLLQADGTAAMSDAETAAQTLASVKDAGSISADRRNAVALCMQKGLVQGFSDGDDQAAGYVHPCGVRKAADDDLKIRERPMNPWFIGLYFALHFVESCRINGGMV